MKKIEVQMLLYTLTKKFMKAQRYMLNPFGVIFFYKGVGWFDGQDIGGCIFVYTPCIKP
jgi:hypothetical protein